MMVSTFETTTFVICNLAALISSAHSHPAATFLSRCRPRRGREAAGRIQTVMSCQS